VFLLCLLFFKLIMLFKGVDGTTDTGPCGVILDFPIKKPPKARISAWGLTQLRARGRREGRKK